MATGKVKWFNNAKGYGFILPDAGGDDLFAHYSSIEMGGYKTLKAGQTVSYETIKGDKGLHAVNIIPDLNTDTTAVITKHTDEQPTPSDKKDISNSGSVNLEAV